MVGNLCTILGFMSLIIVNCLDLFVVGVHFRLFGVSYSKEFSSFLAFSIILFTNPSSRSQTRWDIKTTQQFNFATSQILY
ncbi:hypothetical protein VSP9026_00379 [Vibrio spartinae]|uniref:Uncharacterized protein n=1 Tax=Vibrio spartinae TaxID=1918945 RepID=A0A1N6LZZ3_9VIBR|nr:hypothetical protein VSP9026_00379 [Vibrio spartinae]